ncbi:hypothetical protein PGT21_010222 [Puccinia graminis f. sp. tritici]|uniref:Uncharacterized protein n=1 Tax=Puccinia graminis f. sp. tritici TaxID=56615 RepID=A0A5B0NDU1_PUCGR|nr:hypothetical protein PGT21_010222 [Puccinia graminis f. sp. tritici]KAA1129171.1 hypothetical protein PGTUg99_001680 [Puccinia graminis f. sp. tritici]
MKLLNSAIVCTDGHLGPFTDGLAEVSLGWARDIHSQYKPTSTGKRGPYLKSRLMVVERNTQIVRKPGGKSS